MSEHRDLALELLRSLLRVKPDSRTFSTISCRKTFPVISEPDFFQTVTIAVLNIVSCLIGVFWVSRCLKRLRNELRVEL